MDEATRQILAENRENENRENVENCKKIDKFENQEIDENGKVVENREIENRKIVENRNLDYNGFKEGESRVVEIEEENEVVKEVEKEGDETDIIIYDKIAFTMEEVEKEAEIAREKEQKEQERIQSCKKQKCF